MEGKVETISNNWPRFSGDNSVEDLIQALGYGQ